MKTGRERAKTTSGRKKKKKRLTGETTKIAKGEERRESSTGQQLPQCKNPLKVNFPSSASCQYPCDLNLCRPAICFPFPPSLCTPRSLLASSASGHASGHFKELIYECGWRSKRLLAFNLEASFALIERGYFFGLLLQVRT